VRVILTLRLIGFNRVNRTNFANLTALNVHVFTAFGNLTQMRDRSLTLQGHCYSRSSRLKVTSGYVLAGRCASLDILLCVFAHSASDFDTDTDSTSLMTPCPAAGRQETLLFKTIASAHQANEVAQQMH
jgi:hypothetical protein